MVDDDLDSDTKERLTEEESEIRAYLLHGDQLSEETIEKFTRQFWREEPFKYVAVLDYTQCKSYKFDWSLTRFINHLDTSRNNVNND